MLYIMVTFTIHIPPMLAYIPYMDPMGLWNPPFVGTTSSVSQVLLCHSAALNKK